MDEWLDLDDLLDKSDELVELGLYDEALSLLNQYAEIYNDSWEICTIYGRIYTDQERPAEAIVHLRKGLHLNKNNPECLLGLFYAYSMMHQVDKGGKYLLRAEKHHPDNEMVLTALIWYYTETNLPSQAIGYFEKMQKNGVANADAFRNVAVAYQRSGMYENAEHCFKIALDINPEYEEVRDLLADLYLFIDQEKKAIQLYQDALKKSPKNIRLLSRLIFCYTQLNDFDQATSLAKESIRLYPNSPVGYIDLAYVYLNSNKPELAVDYAEKAHDISPFDPEAYRIKGIAWSEIGNWEKGRSAFTSALEHDPDNTEIMRDYYHHLRNEGDTATMEELVHKVIKIEQPYCLEDYWFLADFYRENGQDLKSFHYLHKAYKNMPGEKELIPPLVDIMLERGHIASSIPFLMHYVQQSGWNETMNDFARHQRFKEKWAQEGLRFLRFQGQRPKDFRSYVFNRSIKRYLLLFGSIIMFLLSCITAFAYSYVKAILFFTGYCLLCALIFLVRHFVGRYRRLHITDTAEETDAMSP
jgi:tetratricopeptide (TPR) repeat protein